MPLEAGGRGKPRGDERRRRRAAAWLLVVAVALGRLRMAVGGRACPGTRADSSSHHQH